MSGFTRLQDFLQSETFYNLMQNYRFASMARQDRVLATFEDVKTAILKAAQSAHGSREAELKEALANMVYQFGYDTVKDGQPAICTGGLSALEGAFAALGWDDPYVPFPPQIAPPSQQEPT